MCPPQKNSRRTCHAALPVEKIYFFLCQKPPLARLEARIALGELVSRVARYDVDPDGIVRVHSINVRGLAALPTSVELR